MVKKKCSTVQLAALEAHWLLVDREPNVSPFTGTPGIKTPLEFISYIFQRPS